MKRLLFLLLIPASPLMAQVTIQSGATVIVQANTYLVVTGNIVSNNNITGNGTVAMKGTTLQSVNFNNFTVPSLQINNPANVQLTGATRINALLSFINGRLILNNNNLVLRTATTTSGASAARYIETNGTGSVVKLVSANLAGFLVPVGSGGRYEPVNLTTSATYSSASISVRNINTIHPNKPAGAGSYLNTFWKIARAGVTGTVTGVATYQDANVVGTESALRAYFYNGSTFSLTGNAINTTVNSLTVNIPVSGDIYGMSIPPAGSLKPSSIGMEETERIPTIAPNPVLTEAVVSIPSDKAEMATLTVIDNNGKVNMMKNVYLAKGSNQHRINMSRLANGTYQVYLKTPTLDKTFTIVKQ